MSSVYQKNQRQSCVSMTFGSIGVQPQDGLPQGCQSIYSIMPTFFANATKLRTVKRSPTREECREATGVLTVRGGFYESISDAEKNVDKKNNSGRFKSPGVACESVQSQVFCF